MSETLPATANKPSDTTDVCSQYISGISYAYPGQPSFKNQVGYIIPQGAGDVNRLQYEG